MHKYTKAVLAVVGALVLPSSPSHAEQNCKIIKDLAQSTMAARQREADILDMLALVEGVQFAPAMEAVAKEIVIDAYEERGWSSKKHQETAVKEFSNKWALACVKGLKASQ